VVSRPTHDGQNRDRSSVLSQVVPNSGAGHRGQQLLCIDGFANRGHSPPTSSAIASNGCHVSASRSVIPRGKRGLANAKTLRLSCAHRAHFRANSHASKSRTGLSFSLSSRRFIRILMAHPVGSKARTAQSTGIYGGGRRVDEGPLPCSTLAR